MRRPGEHMKINSLARLGITAFLCMLAAAVQAQGDSCKNRGDLDTQYCDENKDLVADPPKDPKRFKTPNTLVFTYTPVEDPAVYEQAFRPFTDHLAKCTGKKVVFYQVQSNAAEIEATLKSTASKLGGKVGAIVHPTRLAVTGSNVGPSLYHLLEVLGKEKVLARIDRALSMF